MGPVVVDAGKTVVLAGFVRLFVLASNLDSSNTDWECFRSEKWSKSVNIRSKLATLSSRLFSLFWSNGSLSTKSGVPKDRPSPSQPVKAESSLVKLEIIALRLLWSAVV